MTGAVLHFLGQKRMELLEAGSNTGSNEEFKQLVEGWCPLNMAATSTSIGTHWTKMIVGTKLQLC